MDGYDCISSQSYFTLIRKIDLVFFLNLTNENKYERESLDMCHICV